MPHGHCYLWQPSLIYSHVISDFLIGTAYVAISVTLYFIIRKIKIPFSAVVLAFGVFIGACGATHFMEIWNLWYADYWLSALVKVVTAVASVATSIWLLKLRPQIYQVAEAADLAQQRQLKLEVLTKTLESRVEERTAELKKTQKLLTDILDQTQSPIFVKDLNGQFVLVNNKMAAILARKKRDLLGKTDYDVFDWSQAEAFAANDRRVILGGEPTTLEETVREHGKTQVFISSKFPIRDEENQIYAVGGILTDTTEQKLQAEQLQKTAQELQAAKEQAEGANRTKSQFLANMSHEIRTPLGAMLGFAELMLEEPQLTEGQENSLKTIIRNGEQLYRIINELLDISKVEANKFEVEMVTVDLDEAVRDVTALLSVKAEQKGLAFEVRSQGALPEKITTDPLRFRQILINVIGNAIKFTRRGAVTVDFSLKHSFLEVRVTDTGIGIPRSLQHRLFQPFSQADSANTRNFGGTGLGLYLSQKFAQALGGTITIERSALNEGSTFVIVIDAGNITAQPHLHFSNGPGEHIITAEIKRPSLERLDRVRVLVVDDSTDNLELTRRFLTAAGAQVVCALGAEKAFSVLKQQSFDVILMDIQMPGIDGYEAVKILRRENYTKPIVALTAHAMKGEKERCLEDGFDSYSVKPIDRAALVRQIKLHVAQSNRDPDLFV